MSEKVKAVWGNAQHPERVKEWLKSQGAISFPAGEATKLDNKNLLYFVMPDGRVSFLFRKENDFLFDIEELPRWRADLYENYWYIDDGMKVYEERDYRGPVSDNRYACGNYFQTESEAEEMRNKIVRLLKLGFDE